MTDKKMLEEWEKEKREFEKEKYMLLALAWYEMIGSKLPSFYRYRDNYPDLDTIVQLTKWLSGEEEDKNKHKKRNPKKKKQGEVSMEGVYYFPDLIEETDEEKKQRIITTKFTDCFHGIVVDHNNRVVKLTIDMREIDRLYTLEPLQLKQTLHTMIKIISNLTHLKVLNISFLKLAELPPDIGRLTRLEKLNLRYSRLNCLPATFANLQELKDLNLHHNCFSTFPMVILQLQNLEHLAFSNDELSKTYPGNTIDHLPDMSQLTTLKSLYAYNIDLRSFHPSLYFLPNLEKLVVHGNSSLVIPDIPANSPQSFSLKHLVIKYVRNTQNLHKLKQLGCKIEYSRFS